MGLINWLKDKSFLTLEHDVAILKTTIEGLEMQIETLKGQIASVRAMRRRKLEEEEPTESDTPDMDAIRKAFGGDIPIEFMQKYK